MAGADTRVVSMSEIKSKLLRPALTSHYICDFQPPTSGFLQARVDAQNSAKRYDKLSLACAEASLPGSSLMTNEINDDHTGVSEKQAYRRQYDDRADFTFYVGVDDYYVIRLFESWIGYAVDEQYSNDNIISSNNYAYRVNFPDDYCTGGKNGGSLSITKFEKDYDKTKTSLIYNFVRAFPTSINSMPVSYDTADLLKCTVSFSYSRYWIKQLVSNEIGSNGPTVPGNPEFPSTVITNEYYNNFGQQRQNATNTADFLGIG